MNERKIQAIREILDHVEAPAPSRLDRLEEQVKLNIHRIDCKKRALREQSDNMASMAAAAEETRERLVTTERVNAELCKRVHALERDTHRQAVYNADDRNRRQGTAQALCELASKVEKLERCLFPLEGVDVRGRIHQLEIDVTTVGDRAMDTTLLSERIDGIVKRIDSELEGADRFTDAVSQRVDGIVLEHGTRLKSLAGDVATIFEAASKRMDTIANRVLEIDALLKGSNYENTTGLVERTASLHDRVTRIEASLARIEDMLTSTSMAMPAMPAPNVSHAMSYNADMLTQGAENVSHAMNYNPTYSAPPVAMITEWLNFYPDGSHYSYPTREEANERASPRRIACFPISYAKGEGLK